MLHLKHYGGPTLNNLSSLYDISLLNYSFNSFPRYPDFLMTLKKKDMEDTAERGKNAGKQHFLLFTQCFQQSVKKINHHSRNV